MGAPRCRRYRRVYRLTTGSCRRQPRRGSLVAIRTHRAAGVTRGASNARHIHHRRLLAAAATTVALAATAPAAPAAPIYDVGFPTEPERLQVVRVQVDEGLDWGDAGLGAAGMLALVLVGYGGARAPTRPRREQTPAHS